MAILLLAVCLIAYLVAMTMTIMIIRLDRDYTAGERNPLLRMMFRRLGLIPSAFIGTSLYLIIVDLFYYLYTQMEEFLPIEFLALVSIYGAINDTRWYVLLRRANSNKA